MFSTGMQSFNSDGNLCWKLCRASLRLMTMSNSISLWPQKQFSLGVFTVSVLHRKSVSGLKNLENLQLSPSCNPQNQLNQKNPQTKQEVLSWTVGWGYFPDFTRLVLFQSGQGWSRKPSEQQGIDNKAAVYKCFLCTAWGTYMRDVPFLHDKTVTIKFFLRHKCSYREVL